MCWLLTNWAKFCDFFSVYVETGASNVATTLAFATAPLVVATRTWKVRKLFRRTNNSSKPSKLQFCLLVLIKKTGKIDNIIRWKCCFQEKCALIKKSYGRPNKTWSNFHRMIFCVFYQLLGAACT